ncbi:2' O-ribose methyltransferase [Ceratobasidium sp. 414]|nr:2' O-ribose methyltransferase [Ceratobasidium sp. 414]
MAEKNSELPPRPRRFSRLVSSDLIDIEPIQDAMFVQGDFTDPKTQERLSSLVRGQAGDHATLGYLSGHLAREAGAQSPELDVKDIEARLDMSELSYLFRGEKGADVVLSDMCASVTGTPKDVESSLQLCEMTLAFALENLKQNAGPNSGTLLMRHFKHPELLEFMDKKLKPVFRNTWTFGPIDSRPGEHYFLCMGYRGRKEDQESSKRKRSEKGKKGPRGIPLEYFSNY